VNVGEMVETGDLLGLVGSSGQSSGPHLHFGVKYNGYMVDPWAGSVNPHAGLWVDQEPHVKESQGGLIAGGAFVTSTFGGGSSGVDIALFRGFLDIPQSIAITTDTIGVWMNYMLRANDSVYLQLLTPDDVISSQVAWKTQEDQCGWSNWNMFRKIGGMGMMGTWKFRLYVPDAWSAEIPFEVTMDTVWAPRMKNDVQGKSIKLQENVAVFDTLEYTRCDACELTLTSAPEGVELLPDNVVKFPAANGNSRSTDAVVRLTSSEGGFLDFRYQIVDLTAPMGTVPVVDSKALPQISVSHYLQMNSATGMVEVHTPQGIFNLQGQFLRK